VGQGRVRGQVDGPAEGLQGRLDLPPLLTDRGQEEMGLGVEPLPCQRSLAQMVGLLQLPLVGQRPGALKDRPGVKWGFGLLLRR